MQETTEFGIQSKVTYGNRFKTILCTHKHLTMRCVFIPVFSIERMQTYLFRPYHYHWRVLLRISNVCPIVVYLQNQLNSWNFKVLYTEFVSGTKFYEVTEISQALFKQHYFLDSSCKPCFHGLTFQYVQKIPKHFWQRKRRISEDYNGIITGVISGKDSSSETPHFVCRTYKYFFIY